MSVGFDANRHPTIDAAYRPFHVKQNEAASVANMQFKCSSEVKTKVF